MTARPNGTPFVASAPEVLFDGVGFSVKGAAGMAGKESYASITTAAGTRLVERRRAGYGYSLLLATPQYVLRLG